MFGAGACYNNMFTKSFASDGMEVVRLFDDMSEDMHWSPDIYKQNPTLPTKTLFCIGYRQMQHRLKRFRELQAAGMEWCSWTSPKSCISEMATIGNGCLIDSLANIGHRAVIGDASYVNLSTVVGHDSTIGQGCYLAGLIILNGFTKIGDAVFIGSGSVIREYTTIGSGSVIGQGSNVIHDIPPNVLVYGNPARIIREISPNDKIFG